ncbi:MAG: hypothetical protein AAFR70_00745 [Pseudomonadota bacterium]
MLPPHRPFRNKAKKQPKSAVALGLRQLEAELDAAMELIEHEATAAGDRQGRPSLALRRSVTGIGLDAGLRGSRKVR